jgi:Type IV secretion system pilin
MAEITIPIETNLPDGPTDVGAYISQIAGVALTVAAIAAFSYLVFAGITWIISSGDPKKLEGARNRVINAITGLAIVAASWALFLVLDHFFGLGIAEY